jgi:hypothetical protein
MHAIGGTVCNGIVATVGDHVGAGVRSEIGTAMGDSSVGAGVRSGMGATEGDCMGSKLHGTTTCTTTYYYCDDRFDRDE